jgi:enoyl-CoA hydratase/carnithine racemase
LSQGAIMTVTTLEIAEDGSVPTRSHGTPEGHIYLEVHDHIGYLVIDGPTDLNPMTPDMYKELYDALLEFRDNEDIKVGILTGAGTRAFSAGGNLKAGSKRLEGLTREDRIKHFWNPRSEKPARTSEIFGDILDLEIYKPMVGAVRGPCVGGALVLLLTLTDVRVASTSSKFSLAEVKVGMSGAGGHALIARHVPLTTASWMVLTGEAIDAAEAHRVGMLNEVTPAEEVLGRAIAMAETIAKVSPVVTRVEKELLARSLDLPRRETLRLSWTLATVQKLGHDFEVGYAAFANKSEPDFEGW